MLAWAREPQRIGAANSPPRAAGASQQQQHSTTASGAQAPPWSTGRQLLRIGAVQQVLRSSGVNAVSAFLSDDAIIGQRRAGEREGWINGDIRTRDTCATVELRSLAACGSFTGDDIGKAMLDISIVPADSERGSCFPSTCTISVLTSGAVGDPTLTQQDIVVKQWALSPLTRDSLHVQLSVKTLRNIAHVLQAQKVRGDDDNASSSSLSSSAAAAMTITEQRLFLTLRFLGSTDGSNVHRIQRIRMDYLVPSAKGSGSSAAGGPTSLTSWMEQVTTSPLTASAPAAARGGDDTRRQATQLTSMNDSVDLEIRMDLSPQPQQQNHQHEDSRLSVSPREPSHLRAPQFLGEESDHNAAPIEARGRGSAATHGVGPRSSGTAISDVTNVGNGHGLNKAQHQQPQSRGANPSPWSGFGESSSRGRERVKVREIDASDPDARVIEIYASPNETSKWPATPRRPVEGGEVGEAFTAAATTAGITVLAISPCTTYSAPPPPMGMRAASSTIHPASATPRAVGPTAATADTTAYDVVVEADDDDDDLDTEEPEIVVLSEAPTHDDFLEAAPGPHAYALSPTPPRLVGPRRTAAPPTNAKAAVTVAQEKAPASRLAPSSHAAASAPQPPPQPPVQFHVRRSISLDDDGDDDELSPPARNPPPPPPLAPSTGAEEVPVLQTVRQTLAGASKPPTPAEVPTSTLQMAVPVVRQQMMSVTQVPFSSGSDTDDNHRRVMYVPPVNSFVSVKSVRAHHRDATHQRLLHQSSDDDDDVGNFGGGANPSSFFPARAAPVLTVKQMEDARMSIQSLSIVPAYRAEDDLFARLGSALGVDAASLSRAPSSSRRTSRSSSVESLSNTAGRSRSSATPAAFTTTGATMRATSLATETCQEPCATGARDMGKKSVTKRPDEGRSLAVHDDDSHRFSLPSLTEALSDILRSGTAHIKAKLGGNSAPTTPRFSPYEEGGDEDIHRGTSVPTAPRGLVAVPDAPAPISSASVAAPSAAVGESGAAPASSFRREMFVSLPPAAPRAAPAVAGLNSSADVNRVPLAKHSHPGVVECARSMTPTALGVTSRSVSPAVAAPWQRSVATAAAAAAPPPPLPPPSTALVAHSVPGVAVDRSLGPQSSSDSDRQGVALWCNKHHTSRNGVGRRLVTLRPSNSSAGALVFTMRRPNGTAWKGPAVPITSPQPIEVQSGMTVDGGPSNTVVLNRAGHIRVLLGADAYNTPYIHQNRVQRASNCVVILRKEKVVTALEFENEDDCSRFVGALMEICS